MRRLSGLLRSCKKVRDVFIVLISKNVCCSFSASQVLFDATMSGMYTFDNTLLDSGPLLINATGSGYSYTSSGRVNQAILFSGSAYVQASGFVLLGTVGQR